MTDPIQEIRFERLKGATLERALPDLARLRISVFRDYPYLYEGTLDYERAYLESYLRAADAIIVAAKAGNKIVGCATGSALAGHDDAFAKPLAAAGYDVGQIFYFGESVLESTFRGRGIGHVFFDQRETWAKQRGYSGAAFCAVMRPEDHIARPADYSPLDRFWRARGYRPLDGVTAYFDWLDVDEERATTKPMQVWYRSFENG